MGVGRGSPDEAPPPPGPERTAPRAEAGSGGGWAQRDQPDGMGLGGGTPTEFGAAGRWVSVPCQRPAQPARVSEAESPR